MDIMSELSPIGELYKNEQFDLGLARLWDLWKRIPEPKVDTPNAYLVIEYGVGFSMKLGKLDEAQKWALLAPDFAVVRQDMGEVEFLIGKVAFERGEYEIAKKNFLVAEVKSEGRAFQGEDKKYVNLIR